MKISVKTKYALQSLICLSRIYHDTKYATLNSLAEQLSISKIYLEQVFSLLKRADLVSSIKGSAGGYCLSRNPSDITTYDIIKTIELNLFEPTYSGKEAPSNAIEYAINECVCKPLDISVKEMLQAVSLEMVQTKADEISSNDIMYYI